MGKRCPQVWKPRPGIGEISDYRFRQRMQTGLSAETMRPVGFGSPLRESRAYSTIVSLHSFAA